MNNETWCKIFDTEEHGRILIQKDTNEKDELSVKTTFECEIGQVAFSVSIKTSETEEESQSKLFNGITLEGASKSISNIKKELGIDE